MVRYYVQYLSCQTNPLNNLKHSWLSAVRALGALSSLDPNDVGLENFGSHKPYFPRQIKSLSKVSRSQAAVKDIETGKPVGDIPGWDELIAWYERNLPDERKTGGVRIVHGDYKLDNLVFHPTENRVIGILDWELSTLGSPVRPFLSHACISFLSSGLTRLDTRQLVDLANLTQPWTLEPTDAKGAMVGFKNSPSTEPISLAELEREYCRATQQPYPITEMTFAQSWMLLRVCPIFPFRTSLTLVIFFSWRSSHRELRRDMHNVKRVRSRRIFTLPCFL